MLLTNQDCIVNFGKDKLNRIFFGFKEEHINYYGKYVLILNNSFFNNKMDFFLLIDMCVYVFLFLVPNDNYTPLIVDINII